MPKNKYKKLSIIMPCYNCDSTLKEAIGSVYTQNFNMPYEIIMIDDGSCDNTKNIIKKYAKNDSHIKDFYHDKNQGGTATFDNAVKKATGDVIFCLDSDNVLAPNTLPKMFEYLNKKNADGVAIYERRFFCGKNKKKYKTHINKIINKPIELGDLFNEHNALLDQFMFIKKRYYQAGGHPTHHGFAGQCFERRFLSKGFKVYTCPDTIFYHRQGDEKSWYERVYEKGVLSKNIYLIYEDIMHLFSKKTREQILNYDIYKYAKLYGDNLGKTIKNFYKNNPNEFFIKNKEKYLCVNGRNNFYNDYKNSNSPEDILCLGIYYYWKKEFEKSLECYKKLLKQGFNTKIVYFNILRILMALSGKYKKNEIEEQTDELIKSMQLVQQSPLFEKRKLSKRIINKCKKTIQKFYGAKN